MCSNTSFPQHVLQLVFGGGRNGPSLVVAWALVWLVLCPLSAWTRCDGGPSVLWWCGVSCCWVSGLVCVCQPSGVLLFGYPAPFFSPNILW